ncbi:MAG: GH3 auxin-responsive promoter family protein [Rikenellaceae bacterium]|nr:GH3 auxin-responsive promoter family protein [Rikenellaceae bacterium]
MPLINKIVSLYFTSRRRQIERFIREPGRVQDEQLAALTAKGSGTVYGRRHGIKPGMSAVEYSATLPVTDYESMAGYIEQAKKGGENILWPGRVNWFAKSSGTTSSRSKFIPVTGDGLDDCHLQGPRDVVAFFTAAYPRSKVFSGKTLTLGGSKKIEKEGDAAFSGDLSAILLDNVPGWANMRRVPSMETALIADFNEKVERICKETLHENVTSFAGVPSWNLVMFNKILEITGKDNILEIWPGMELFIHGGMNFKPYRSQYNRIIPSADMKYLETYNASEGFFSIADETWSDDMLLMLDYGIYYEFIPVQSLHDSSTAVPLEGVRRGVNYAMLISSSNGLWRYMIGDTVEFTSTSPYRIRITGRTKHYINAFGEEVVIENAESAVREASILTDAHIAEYTVAPVYMGDGGKGAHQWIVEFTAEPASVEAFAKALDATLRRINSDYDAKRTGDSTLEKPRITVVPPGTFYRWMESRGKIGGQNKVPRLYNDRTYADQLVKVAEGIASEEFKEKVPV